MLTGVAIYLCWRVLQPFANVILWSLVLALLFAPLNRKLLANTRRPNLSAALTLPVAVVSVLLPLTAHQSDLLLARTVEVVHGSVFGVVAIALLQGALGGAIFAILGLPSPLLWGVVMAFFAMIPMVGAGVIWLPAAILLLATGHTGKAIALCAVGALVISTIDNFLRPRIARRTL